MRTSIPGLLSRPRSHWSPSRPRGWTLNGPQTPPGPGRQRPARAPGAGYVAVTGTPAATGFGPVTPLVGTDPDVPFPVQNIFYTVQWLIFAGVIVVIWGRFLREDIRAARAVESEARG